MVPRQQTKKKSMANDTVLLCLPGFTRDNVVADVPTLLSSHIVELSFVPFTCLGW